MIRKFKEQYSYIGETEYGKRVQVPIGGKPKKFEIGKQISIACNRLLEEIFNATQEAISMASAESVFEMLQNIIITGGGSRIKNIAPELQRLLLEDGYASPKVSTAGDNYKEFVAIGAYKAAKGAKDNQWLSR
jgi:rod shape-determining protein MreB